jgi:hypothetical protein
LDYCAVHEEYVKMAQEVDYEGDVSLTPGFTGFRVSDAPLASFALPAQTRRLPPPESDRSNRGAGRVGVSGRGAKRASAASERGGGSGPPSKRERRGEYGGGAGTSSSAPGFNGAEHDEPSSSDGLSGDEDGDGEGGGGGGYRYGRDGGGGFPPEVPVTCNSVRGIFVFELTKVRCQCCGWTEYTPTQWEQHCGAGSAKKWKASIKVEPGCVPEVPARANPMQIGKWFDLRGLDLKSSRAAGGAMHV